MINFDELEAYLVAEKRKCETEAENAHARNDFATVQYYIGRKHGLTDMLIEAKTRIKEATNENS